MNADQKFGLGFIGVMVIGILAMGFLALVTGYYKPEGRG